MTIEGYDELTAQLVLGCSAIITPCGSKVTCNPPPEGGDTDYLVLIEDNENVIRKAISILSEQKFFWEGSEHYQSAMGNFMSWRKDDLNLIVTCNSTFAQKHKIASALCKKLNVMNKAHRIAIFQAILYGNVEED